MKYSIWGLFRSFSIVSESNMQLRCRTWSQFVTCVKRYIDRCFTESRRQEFNKAVENPVDSVYQMCTVPQYQSGE